jgi:LacI family transcriptional regulator
LRHANNKRSKADVPLVGVVVDAASSYGRQVLRGVLNYANLQRRWRLHEELRPRREVLDYWPRCDGAIFAGGGMHVLDHVRERSRHTIACSGAADPQVTPVVSLDDLAAGELAAEHLIDCRLEQFAFHGTVVGDHRHIGQRRLAGFRRGLQRKGYDCIESPVPYPRDIDRLTHAHWPDLIAWVRQLPKPIGIMVAEDGVGHDLAAACLEGGIAVPDQIAIVSVDNDDLLCEGAWPPLSSIEPDFTRMGYQAAALLDRLLRGEKLSPEQWVIRLPPIGVVQRVSTSVLAVKDPALAEAVQFIRQHACDPCSVEDVLREVAVGRRWLERQFVAQLGRTPHEEIVRVRIENSKRLLLRPEFGVIHVAERCGFSKVQFMRAFRQLTGTTPAVYRRQALRGTGRASA